MKSQKAANPVKELNDPAEVKPRGGSDERRYVHSMKMSKSPMFDSNLMEAILDGDNLKRALRRVKSNKGAPGVDGMTVQELPGYLKENWSLIKEQLLKGEYHPKEVRRVEIPKPGKKEKRQLGIPTCLDRFIQQGILQVLQRQWDERFSESCFGFRPGRSAHQAVRRSQDYIRSGYDIVVDIDLEKFLETSSYYTPFHERFSKRVGWVFNTLIRKPFRFPDRRWTAESSPRFTRCNTVCRDTPRNLVASCMGT